MGIFSPYVIQRQFSVIFTRPKSMSAMYLSMSFDISFGKEEVFSRMSAILCGTPLEPAVRYNFYSMYLEKCQDTIE